MNGSLFVAHILDQFLQNFTRGWVRLEIFPVSSLLDLGNVFRDELHSGLLQLGSRVSKREQPEFDGVLDRKLFDQKKFAFQAQHGNVVLVGGVELENKNNSKLPHKLYISIIVLNVKNTTFIEFINRYTKQFRFL